MFDWYKISNHIQGLQKKIENLLHEDLGAKDSDIEKMKNIFSVSQDDVFIRALSHELPEDEEDRLVTLFSRLSSFFEVGIFCVDSAPAIAFIYGQFKSLSEKSTISLPVVGPSRSLRTQNDSLWENLSVFKWIKDERMTALLVQLDHKHSFILFSKLADPWLKIHFDKVHHEILKA